MEQSASVSITGDGSATITVSNVNAASPNLPNLFTDLAKVAADLEASAPGAGGGGGPAPASPGGPAAPLAAHNIPAPGGVRR